ncbi:spermidine/putrescine ABC transporter ATP-binding protein [Lachnoclostridium sp. An131]|uniref:ABC transporter ATP-binding protein n=1 Tax=Lachnoclostridium sp. An131 TaxID=1965555 RepID=UPI000B36E19D|nr:ABC transporter ATP-binding protein [Lachnoclostridium sp. An131]OUQ24054.1 spermidine/putrescine ABC transporter ATP-binding protein [Lachnoclostridium sp. An131]
MSDTRGNVIIRLTDVDKSFDDERVVKKLNLDVEEGEFLTMLGPSGCGKTTTLRMIAGFEVPTSGQIFLEGEDVDDKKPNERNVNTVFQNYALFPHMNVFDNIAFGLVEKKVKKDEIRSRVEEMIKLVQLDGMEKRMPAQMSGGQKQRVAIARALVNRPKVLLLDEPLGALDLKLRKQMQGELKALQRRLGITFIYVTHDQEEALTMSDRIAVMNRGRLEQVGTPEEVYNHPETKFVADFIGESNIIEGYIENMTDDSIEVTMESGKAIIHETGYRMEEMVYLCIRPENLKISTEEKEGFRFRGQVKEHIFIGSTNKTMIEMPNGQMLKSVTPAEDELIPVGTAVNVFWNPGKAVVMRTKEEQIYNVIEQSVEIEGMTNDQIF